MKSFDIQSSFSGITEFENHMNTLTKLPIQRNNNFVESQTVSSKMLNSPKLKKLKTFTDQKIP